VQLNDNFFYYRENSFKVRRVYIKEWDFYNRKKMCFGAKPNPSKDSEQITAYSGALS